MAASVYVRGMHAQFGECFAQAFRMHGARRQRPGLIPGSGRIWIQIGDRDAVNRLRRMTGKPAKDVSLESSLGKNVPDRLDFARCARDRPDAAVLRVRLHEPVDAMLVRTLAGGDGIPQHGRENGPQSRQIPHDAMVDEIVQSVHQALIHVAG